MANNKDFPREDKIKKICTKCLTNKELSEYAKHSATFDNLQCRCKDCRRIDRRLHYIENRDTINKKSKISADKRKDKISLNKKRYHIKNKSKIQQIKKEYYYANKDIILNNRKVYYNKNKEYIQKRTRQYYRNNPGLESELSMKKHTAKLKASPRWVTKEMRNEIKALYVQARQLEKLDGIKRHVDHIIPLQGKTVCGLHVPWNLQILTASENCRKHNKL